MENDGFDIQALTTATHREIADVVEDHGATVDNLVARYNRVDKAHRDAFAYPADSPGSALYRQENRSSSSFSCAQDPGGTKALCQSTDARRCLHRAPYRTTRQEQDSANPSEPLA